MFDHLIVFIHSLSGSPLVVPAIQAAVDAAYDADFTPADEVEFIKVLRVYGGPEGGEFIFFSL